MTVITVGTQVATIINVAKQFTTVIIVGKQFATVITFVTHVANVFFLTYKFFGIVNKHAPLKKKFARGNNSPFMNREIQK